MALHINSAGIQKEIDLDLNSAILFWGKSPVPCTEIQMADVLGLESDEKFECKRLDDGRLLFYSGAHDVDSIQVLLTQEESSLVETVEENHARSTSTMDYDESLIKRMMISDVVPGDGNYSSIFAQARIFSSKLTGIRLLIAMLFAEKMVPTDVWHRSGLAACAFLREIEAMKNEGVFDGWHDQ